MRSNSGPGKTASGSLDRYDTLPRFVRRYLANANHNWSPDQCHAALVKLDGECEDLVDHLRNLEYRMRADHYAILASGKPYPKSP